MRSRKDVRNDHVQTFLARACCENVWSLFACLKNAGIPSHNWPNMFPGVGLTILDNMLENCEALARAEWQLQAPAGAARPNVVARNKAAGLDALFEISAPHTYAYEGIRVRNNEISGDQPIQVRVEPQVVERV